MWANNKLEAKRKLRYFKEVSNPNLENQKYLPILTSVKNKINIAKLRTNSHDFHIKTRCWPILKTPWDETVCHLCDTKRVEDEKHFLLDYLAYTQTRSKVQNICHAPNLLDHLT